MKLVITLFVLIGPFLQAQTIKKDTLLEKDRYMIGETVNGVKQGYWKSYIGTKDNLILYAEGTFNNDEKEGKWITYGHEDHSKSKEEHFKNDAQNGEEIYYYPNGNIASKGNYIDDEPDGEHLSYYENGLIRTMENYDQGTEEGKFIQYFDNGHPEAIGNFKNGEFFGEFVHYDAEGKILNKGSFIDGEKTGAWIETEERKGGLGIPETVQIRAINYSTNEETRKIYNKPGLELDRTEYYKDGVLIEIKE